MKTKNSKQLLILGLVLLLVFAGASYMYQQNNMTKVRDFHNSQIDVGPIKLWQKEEDVFSHLDTRPEEEMCVYGYEFNFDKEMLNLGFRMDNNTLRRITVRNTEDSLYDINCGLSLKDAEKQILSVGFTKDLEVKNRFVMGDVYFTLGSKKGEQVDFMIVEIIDEKILNYAQ